MTTTFLKGFSLGASLIIAIGSQNAFVLRQGLRREHVLPVCLVCFACDALLILLGVAGLGTLVSSSRLLMQIALWGGGIFLFAYGIRAFRSAFRPQSMEVDETSNPASGLRWAILTTLALTLLNPHVYLDTVVLLGSISGQFPAPERPAFALGAVSASLVWFFGLGYGARILTPLFRRELSWRVLDLLIGCVMWGIAASLLWEPLTGQG